MLFVSLNILGFSQIKIEKKDAIGLSIPLILNNSNGGYYSFGNSQEPKGKAISYGISINYSKQLYKNWFAIVGGGYFKQSFNISRPFDFDGDTVTKLLYSTKNYNYHCVTFNAGPGYSYALNDKLEIHGLASFNLLHSFKQSYTPTRYSGSQHKTTQTNRRNMQIGYMVNISADLEYLLTNNISVGAGLVFPLLIKWKDDKVFIGNDSQTIAENKFSIGTAISCKYHF